MNALSRVYLLFAAAVFFPPLGTKILQSDEELKNGAVEILLISRVRKLEIIQINLLFITNGTFFCQNKIKICGIPNLSFFILIRNT